MKAQDINSELEIASEDVRRIAMLAAAVRVICVANQMRLREQSLMVTRHPRPPVPIDFTEREPFGFAFTAGHEATFNVPSAHRFVIEHVDVCCWAKNDHVDVRLITRSRHMFRHLTLEQSPVGEHARTGTAAPILVNESTANTFLFSNGEVHDSSTIPPDTYVQVWGYLEPAYDGESL